jgi:hypothetical protein
MDGMDPDCTCILGLVLQVGNASKLLVPKVGGIINSLQQSSVYSWSSDTLFSISRTPTLVSVFFVKCSSCLVLWRFGGCGERF